MCKGKHKSPTSAGRRVQTATEREQKCIFPHRCRWVFWEWLNQDEGDMRPRQEQQPSHRLRSNKEMS